MLDWASGPVAQRLEQWTHNPLVQGSNPCGPTIVFPSGFDPLKIKEHLGREQIAVLLPPEGTHADDLPPKVDVGGGLQGPA